MDNDRIAEVLVDIQESYEKARKKHTPMRGPHEGYAVLLEEVDELWAEVKRWQPTPTHEPADEYDAQWLDCYRNRQAVRKEALHVAAMALAFLLEVCE